MDFWRRIDNILLNIMNGVMKFTVLDELFEHR